MHMCRSLNASILVRGHYVGCSISTWITCGSASFMLCNVVDHDFCLKEVQDYYVHPKNLLWKVLLEHLKVDGMLLNEESCSKCFINKIIWLYRKWIKNCIRDRNENNNLFKCEGTSKINMEIDNYSMNKKWI